MDLKILKHVSDYEWVYPQNGETFVDIHFYGDRAFLEKINQDTFEKLKLTASLPGIKEKVVALPNLSASHDFPSGTVCAFDSKNGSLLLSALSGGLNSGVRTITTNLILPDIDKKMKSVMSQFASAIPIGNHAKTSFKLKKNEVRKILSLGSKWVVENREGDPEDLSFIENSGVVSDADASLLTDEEVEAARQEFGFMGMGNHFFKIHYVDEIYDIERARTFGLFKNQIILSIHTGSLSVIRKVLNRYKGLLQPIISQGASEAERSLGLLPFNEPQVQEFFKALGAVANFAYANRQMLSQQLLLVFENIIRDIETRILYDHSLHSLQQETLKGRFGTRSFLVHRKGSCRSLAGNSLKLPQIYRMTGQPVLLNTSFNQVSYILAGTKNAIDMSFGSNLSFPDRGLADSEGTQLSASGIRQQLKDANIFLHNGRDETLLENATNLSRDPEKLVQSLTKSGLSLRVARLQPLAIITG